MRKVPPGRLFGENFEVLFNWILSGL